MWKRSLMANDSACFFHAEDSIRHLYVTGVQTCALPIYNNHNNNNNNLSASVFRTAVRYRLGLPVARPDEIGRASCREREKILERNGNQKKKRQQNAVENSKDIITKNKTKQTNTNQKHTQ